MNSLVMQLRYIGVIPQRGYREYGFQIGDREAGNRIVVLTIDDEIFQKRELSFQEAPDLCYQKLLTGLRVDAAASKIPAQASVTMSDIAEYRASHPVGRRPGRKSA
jgi:hypothetical protein